MALVQDKGFLINFIRAQYLTTADDDQGRRIIRPYTNKNGDSPGYPEQEMSEEFNDVLTRTESPPIPINVLEESDLMRKLHMSKESLAGRIDETDEEEQDEPFDHNTLKSQVLNPDNPESKASLATLKFNQDTASDHESDTLTSQISQAGKKLSSTKISYRPPFTKLFKNNSSHSSTQSSLRGKKMERKKPVGEGQKGEDGGQSDDDDFKEDEGDEDDDDDDDDDDESYDDSENFDDQNTNASRTNTESDLVNLEDIVDNTASQRHDESGILVDQNYSDVNAASGIDHFNESKYLYGDNSISSVDDQLLLDSDFSDEDDDDIIDNALHSARLQMLQSKTPSTSATPSRFNRKLSFEKQPRPKLRPKRSSSLSVKNQDDTSEYLRHSYSNPNMHEMDKAPGQAFEKTSTPAEPKLKSQLTAMINRKYKAENADPLEYFLFVSGENISNRFDVINMNVYLPQEKTITVQIRKTVTVFETIGFILFNTVKRFPDLLKTAELRNPNKWCLKLIDDDGEPYEGSFGLMDRTKVVSSYGEDEVALIEVSDSEFRVNELKTPLPVSDNEVVSSGTPSPSKLGAFKQTNYFKSIIPKVDNNIKDAATVNISIYKYPATSDSTFTGLEFPLTAKLNELLLKYTKVKDLDPNDYLLKVIGEDYVLDLNDSVSSLDGSYKLEILTKRKTRELQLKKKKILDNNTLPTINSNLTPHSLMVANDLKREADKAQIPSQQSQGQGKPTVQRRHSFSSKQFSSSFTKHGISSSFKNKNSSRNSLRNSNDPMIPNTVTADYRKFTVWRRLPMSFINRHERSFAIDGEYVYILPKDYGRNWYDTNNKTRTFHVSQIISCKVSKRIPSNFKIVVMKTNGPKRYDFEALNPAESAEIISRLHKVMDAYKVYKSPT